MSAWDYDQPAASPSHNHCYKQNTHDTTIHCCRYKPFGIHTDSFGVPCAVSAMAIADHLLVFRAFCDRLLMRFPARESSDDGTCDGVSAPTRNGEGGDAPVPWGL